MKTTFALIAFTAFQFAIAQKTIELKEFKSLTVASDSQVTMVKSNKDYLIINGEDDESTDINNEGGSLVLNSDTNYILYYKSNIENITIASDAILSCDEEIKSNQLTITADSDAIVTLAVNVKQLQTTANSDAVVTLTGKAVNHSAAFNSDAQLNAKSLITENSNIVLSSDAVGLITAKKIVNATVSSDASLTIYGNPDKVNKNISDDGEIIVK
ncbi:hypothetical protein GWA97_05515 [Flavobacterium sp. LaA7.5]|nr:hypothetical protein [Flavobacterium salilacus subsp. altitudinum]